MRKDQEYDYFYEENDSNYCYPNSNVLINKLNIKDSDVLHKAERDITEQRYYSLLKKGVTGDFSLKHLQSIHKYLFQDVYEWAGKIRTVDIAKGNIFCLTQFIEQQFTVLHQELSNETFLKDISDAEEMAIRLAYYLSEINVIHPFREGNGRAQRAYCQQLCQNNGRFALDYSLVSKEEMIEASVASFNTDYSLMRKIMKKCLISGEY